MWRSQRWHAPLLALLLQAILGAPSWGQQRADDSGIERVYGEVFAQRGGRELLADIYRPQGDGPFPGVLMIHGGGWMSGSRWNMVMHANALARAGYVVVNIEYRLAPAHKHPAQLEDCLDAWRWLNAHADELHIDREKLALYGYSAGAHLACLVGLNPPDEPELARPRAIVGGGTPCDFDWIPEESNTLAYFLGGSRQQFPDRYREASPITYVSPDDPPVFLFHGDRDSMVPIQSAERLQKLLEKDGVHCQLDVIPGEGHVAAFLDPQSPDRAIRFLNSIFLDEKKTEKSARDSEQMPPEKPAPTRNSDAETRDNGR